ncbi:hypothetical protein CAC42_6328 [Sphaceloma murrayae]|uniref:3-methyl-2-oxobutanoate dehydrogenase (2-methylpropanoyl-transferring) n=1 Tax=Sphaceloma murrayae TaxID=2082308 RepID=A0A2K1QMK5_9PEZI|nr:hypothetical protein CAC42_6328 [Sphaceloma murrayae]
MKNIPPSVMFTHLAPALRLSGRRIPRSRHYATHPPSARLNLPTDFSTTPLLHHTAKSALSDPELPQSARLGSTSRLNLFQSINSALSSALRSDPSVLLFGEDVAFGGVFRCSMNLATEFGDERVFNTPLSEQGIVGFAIGAAMEGAKAVAEVQFADYVYPAFDQLVNEAAKVRYHSQSPESLFTHIPGLRVVIPRSPSQAKGLLLSAIKSRDPVLFMEPKILYRATVEHVPAETYELPLSKAQILKPGTDMTVISYGTPLYTCHDAIARAEQDFGCQVELIDLRTVYPWDRQTVIESVKKTGRAVVVHESMVNAGVGAEVAATIQEQCFLRLESPVQRVAGWSTHSGLLYEKFNVPDVVRVYEAIRKGLEY